MSPPRFLVYLSLVASVACAATPDDDRATAAAAELAAGPDPQIVFWESLTTLCDQAFEGRVVESQPPDTSFAGKTLVMHVRECLLGEIRIPFQVGDDRSRTWVITTTETGLRLKHDHRHADGKVDAITQYGGDTQTLGTASAQEFHADSLTAALVPAAATNVWTIELQPGKLFAYALRRDGTERRFRVEFDLTRPVASPPPPLGSLTGGRTMIKVTIVLGALALAVSGPGPTMSGGELRAVASMEAARAAHTMTTLPDGRVLVVGGFGATEGRIAGTVIYQPTTERFVSVRGFTVRHSHSATLLANGTVLIVGGYDANGGYLDQAEVFDPPAGTVRPVGRLRYARADHTATLLNDGTVLITGGAGTAVDSPACKILDNLYHQQITEGNLIPNIDAAWTEIAYFQIGDNPGRKEPTTGEINFANIFRHVREKGYTGILGMEHGNSQPGREGEAAVINAYRLVDGG